MPRSKKTPKTTDAVANHPPRVTHDFNGANFFALPPVAVAGAPKQKRSTPNLRLPWVTQNTDPSDSITPSLKSLAAFIGISSVSLGGQGGGGGGRWQGLPVCLSLLRWVGFLF
ncbi:hypothetical protein TIFTF001_054606 [Ficus carica]|uniref:Uncharacterized protein n=1 Tax=Ficus carica TaxID=3494 RepID=A0AA88EKK9_FICCA|nr:hypothetical protein TIFTF001_054606 [Ficus carica]